MNATLKIGAFLSFVGFVAVGSAVIYGSNSGAVSLQDAVQAAKNAGTAQGVGWIAVGLGIATALLGLGLEIHDLATVVPDISGFSPKPPPPLKARKVAKVNRESNPTPESVAENARLSGRALSNSSDNEKV